MFVLTLVLTSAFSFSFADAETVNITVLQTSDMHGRIYPHDYAN